MLTSVCVYCGSRRGNDRFVAAASALGGLLAARGITTVYGGGNIGLMGALADAALAAGGRVIGVIPRALVDRELAHQGVTELHVVDSLHQRKALMARLSDGFVAMPGGAGTLDELFETLTWAQLGLHHKAIGLLDVDRYWQPLLAAIDHAVTAGFVDPAHRQLLSVDDRPGELLDALASRAS